MTTVLFFVLIALQQPPVTAVDPKVNLDAGIEAMRKEVLGDAEVLLTKALEEARATGNTEIEWTTHFYLGLIWQRRGEIDPQLREDAYTKAAAHYEAVLERNPKSVGALNNLTVIYTHKKEFERAETLIQQALKQTDDVRWALFNHTAGDLYDAMGQTKKAARYYRVAAERSPAREQREKLLDYLLEHGKESEEYVDQALDYLWQALRRGEVDAVLAGTLRALEGKHDGDEPQALFAIIAASLARKTYDAADYEATGIPQRLAAMTCEGCALAARSIRDAYDGKIDLETRKWWTAKPSRDDEGPVRPAEAYRQLLRSVGQRAQQTGNLDLAETSYEHAFKLDESLDVQSAVLLTNIWLSRGRVQDANRLVTKVEPELPGLGDWQAVYGYHRSIGTMYAARDLWTAPSPATSAVYHLTKADESLTRLNEERLQAQEKAIDPDPFFKMQLAGAYDRSGERKKGIQAIVDAAIGYVRRGDTLSARVTIARVPYAELPETARGPFADLIAPAVKISGEETWPDDLLVAIKGGLLAFATAEDGAQRQAVMTWLAPYEVKDISMNGANGVLVLAGEGRETRVGFEIAAVGPPSR